MEETKAIVPLDYHKPEPMPVPIPAANKRSPNRKARTRGALQHFHNLQARKNWLLMFESTGDETKASDSINRSPGTIRLWKRDIPAFKTAVDRIAANWRDRNQAALANMDGRAIQALGRMIDDEGDHRGASDMAYKLLKGAGYFREPDMPPVVPGTTYIREREKVTVVNMDAPEEE